MLVESAAMLTSVLALGGEHSSLGELMFLLSTVAAVGAIGLPLGLAARRRRRQRGAEDFK